jgi:hypothetical protein
MCFKGEQGNIEVTPDASDGGIDANFMLSTQRKQGSRTGSNRPTILACVKLLVSGVAAYTPTLEEFASSLILFIDIASRGIRSRIVAPFTQGPVPVVGQTCPDHHARPATPHRRNTVALASHEPR